MHAAQSLLDQRLRALADPTRRDILGMIRNGDAAAGDIAERFTMTRPAVSRHLRVLREAKLVEIETAGTSRRYRADPVAMSEMSEWFVNFWDNGLPRLKRLAEQKGRQR